MLGFYDNIWDSIRQCNEVNYIRPVLTMEFWNLLCPILDSKIIVMDSDGLFAGMFKETFRRTSLIPVHEVARGNHNAIKN